MSYVLHNFLYHDGEKQKKLPGTGIYILTLFGEPVKKKDFISHFGNWPYDEINMSMCYLGSQPLIISENGF
jgi:hypothetical protein